MSASAYRERIDRQATKVDRARAAFEPPADPPDEARAREHVTEGFGPTVAVYVDARTGDRVRFDEAAFHRLERTMNAWLELYAACYGVEMDADFTVRSAAEALLDTHDAVEAAGILTGVPTRTGSR